MVEENEVVANPEKFQAILIKKDRSDTSVIDISLVVITVLWSSIASAKSLEKIERI